MKDKITPCNKIIDNNFQTVAENVHVLFSKREGLKKTTKVWTYRVSQKNGSPYCWLFCYLSFTDSISGAARIWHCLM